MFDSDDVSRHGRALPRKASPRVAPAGRPGSLLAADIAAESDAAHIHGRARARREKRPSLLLSAPLPAEHDDRLEEKPPMRPALDAAPRSRIRDFMSGSGSDADDDDDRPIATGASEELDAAAVPHDGAAGIEANNSGQASSLRRTAIGMTIAGAAIGAAVAFAWPKSYIATSEMLIDPREAQLAGSAGSYAPLTADAAFALVDNQLRILRSGSMLDAAAERLNLAADGEFNGAAAGPFGLGSVLSGIGDLLGRDGAVENRRRHVVDALDSAIHVERVGGSSVVRVSARTADPQKSALIANTISDLFLGNLARAPMAAGEAAGEMAARLEQLREGVDEAERAIETFKAENELIDARGTLITDEEILRLGEQLSAAKARTVELNARAASTQDANVDSIVTGSLPEQYASATLTELRSRYAGLKQQVERMTAKLGPRHPERLAAEAELEGARQEIGGELRRIASALQTELKRAVQQEQELAAQLARMKVRQGDIGNDLVALRELERNAQARREAYERSLRVAQAGGQSLAPANASLISRAEPPLHATSPSMPAFSLAGALAGLLAGLGFGGWRRMNDGEAEAALPRAALEDDTTSVATQASVPRQSAADEPWIAHATAPDGARNDKEADDMYPYTPYAQPMSAAPDHGQPAPQPSGQAPYYQQGPVAAPLPPQAMTWPPQQFQQPQMPAHPHPVVHHPAPPPYAAWPGMPQQMAQQQMIPPPPHDPWAHLRGYAPPPQAHPAAGWAPPPAYPPAYAPLPPQQHYAAPAAEPYPARHEPAQQPARAAEPPRRPAADYDHDAFVDDRTNEAIEEIRQSLREFREAIEDFADSREPHRRYGT